MNQLHDLEQFIGKGFFSNWGDVDIDMDVYEKDWTKTTDRKQMTITMPWAWNSVETSMFKDVDVPNIWRVIIRITSADKKAHKFTFIQLATTSKWPNTTSLNLTDV